MGSCFPFQHNKMLLLRRIALAAFTLLISSVIGAQTSEFESLKQQFGEHSLPLVNLTVDLSKVNASTFVDGRKVIVP